MNKKFSTLVASALLATAFSASAQLQVKAIDGKIETAAPTRYYVLNTVTTAGTTFANATGTALTLDADTVDSKLANFADINKQLWTIKVTAVAGSNRFVLTNPVNGATLSFAPQYAVAANASGVVTVPTAATDMAYKLTGANTEWSWVSAPNAPVADLQAVKELTCAFRTDSTMALAVVTASGKVFAYKYANNSKPATIVGATLVSAQALIPGTKAMAAADLNVLGTAPAATYFTLNSGKTGLVGDIFTGKKFHAEDATTGTVNLNLIGADAKVSDRYAYVDTAFHTATGLNQNKLYKLAINNKKDETNFLADEAMEFQIVRDLFKDSLVVSVDKAALKEKATIANANTSFWQTAQSNATMQTYVIVSAIKLTDNTEVFTLFEADGTTVGANNTNLTFGANSVTADDTRYSVADGLYYIMNSKGQYWTSLIHENGSTSVRWATIKETEQNVAHMPAFQWVMLKANNYSDQAKAISPMIVTNREFAAAGNFSGQLHKNPGATYVYISGSSDSLSLVPITDAAILGDTLLGYKNFQNNELLVKTYTFNYLHPYALDKFIAKSAKDSILNVLDGNTAFSLEKGQNIAYGYKIENANGRIAGLKQLYRTNYKMYVPTVGGKLYVSLATENKFALSKYFAAVDSFYFKENNQIGEKCYHAMVKANVHELAGFKVGVADDDQDAILKQQVIGETRTSSFNIAPFDSPLYRRFNTELEGVAGDASDTLRFVEKYRGEYLQIENNPNFILQKGIDYLGIYTAANAKSGLAFIVDTAWVNRGNGEIKPQYLISIERNDLKTAEGEKCPVCAALVAAGKPALANCPHDGKARLGFNRGKYLVNFQDSTTTSYRWKGYTRAGFVDAVNMGDSLYILVNEFKGIKNADVDTAKIIAAYTTAKINGKYIINLKGDNHKYVTWSMRYMDPAKTATDKTFLMESMKLAGDKDIAPFNAAWLKMQNGCLVLSDPNASTFDVFTGGDDALIFDVKHVADDEVATDNESINTTVVSVVAGEGVVTIKNAANKTVAISNILGQTIANTVVTSDNATINVPAGLVVVSVEGEAAVKAIVR